MFPYPFVYAFVMSFAFGCVVGVVVAWKAAARRIPPRDGLVVIDDRAASPVDAGKTSSTLRRVA